MSKCQKLIDHAIANSTSYLVVIFTFSAGVYEIWKSKENKDENIKRTILAFIAFSIGILEVIDIQILNLCFRKKRIQQQKILSAVDNLNKILINSLLSMNNNGNNPNDPYYMFLSTLIRKIKDLKDNLEKIEIEVERIRQNQNQNLIEISNDDNGRPWNRNKRRRKKKKKNF